MIPRVIDNTMRKSLVLCQKKAYWEYEQMLRPIEPNINFVAGAAFAAGLKVMRQAFFVEGRNPEHALQDAIAAVYESYGQVKCPAKSNKSVDRVAGAVMFYANMWPIQLEKLQPVVLEGKHMIEVSRSIQLPLMHKNSGKLFEYAVNFDMLGHDGNEAWIIDEKLTTRLGDSWAMQWDLDSQMTGYCYTSKKLMEEAGLTIEVKGAIVRGISVLKEGYGKVEVPTLRPDWQLYRWYNMLLRDIKDWQEASINSDHKMALDHSCAMYNSPCEYAKLCLAHDPERLIPGNYEQVIWNPLGKK
jgi:hypothetical protein